MAPQIEFSEGVQPPSDGSEMADPSLIDNISDFALFELSDDSSFRNLSTPPGEGQRLFEDLSGPPVDVDDWLPEEIEALVDIPNDDREVMQSSELETANLGDAPLVLVTANSGNAPHVWDAPHSVLNSFPPGATKPGTNIVPTKSDASNATLDQCRVTRSMSARATETKKGTNAVPTKSDARIPTIQGTSLAAGSRGNRASTTVSIDESTTNSEKGKLMKKNRSKAAKAASSKLNKIKPEYFRIKEKHCKEVSKNILHAMTKHYNKFGKKEMPLVKVAGAAGYTVRNVFDIGAQIPCTFELTPYSCPHIVRTSEVMDGELP